MFTGIYWPKDHPNAKYHWVCGDVTHIAHGFAYLEGPSFCVRLIVFEMPDD